jgi:hypothetical protein
MSIIIERYEEFTSEVANQTVGHIFAEKISDVVVRGLGEGVGLMSSIARGHLTFESGREETVIVKCIARTENSELSKGLNFYKNEINFYLHLADETPIKIPRCLYAAVDPVTQNFLLVLEDLGAERAGDQLEGCTEEERLIAFARAAELHAVFWGRATEFDWLNYQVDMKTILFRRDKILRPGIEPMLERFPDYFTGDRVNIVRKIGDQYIDLFLNAMKGEPTIIHGDYRVDNVFLTGTSKSPDIIAFDWQNTMGGNGTQDIAYFSAGGCDESLRGESEQKALRHYYDRLIDGGVKDYSFDECIEQYRYNMLVTMITPIAICGTLDQGNERGVKLGTTMLERALTALESMSCDQLLG